MATSETCGTSKATSLSAEETTPVPSQTGRRKILNRKKFNRRKETLLKQARELRILCGCQVAMFCVQQGGEMEVWESEEAEVQNTLNAYLQEQHREEIQRVSSKRRKLNKEKDADAGEEPVATASSGCTDRSLRLGLGLTEDSCETSNSSDHHNMETDSARLVKLPLIRDGNCEDGNQIDLELRLGF